MVKGFGQGGPGADNPTSVPALIDVMNPSGRSLSTDPGVLAALERIVWESVQLLEHSSLVYWESYTHAKPDLRLTRAGSAALADSSVEKALG